MLTSLAQSRLVAPLVITPSEMDFPTTDDNGNAQTFGSWLNKAMAAAVSDPRTRTGSPRSPLRSRSLSPTG